MSNPDCNRKLLEVNKRHTNILTRISQLVDYINQFELLKEKVKIDPNDYTKTLDNIQNFIKSISESNKQLKSNKLELERQINSIIGIFEQVYKLNLEYNTEQTISDPEDVDTLIETTDINYKIKYIDESLKQIMKEKRIDDEDHDGLNIKNNELAKDLKKNETIRKSLEAKIRELTEELKKPSANEDELNRQIQKLTNQLGGQKYAYEELVRKVNELNTEIARLTDIVRDNKQEASLREALKKKILELEQMVLDKISNIKEIDEKLKLCKTKILSNEQETNLALQDCKNANKDLLQIIETMKQELFSSKNTLAEREDTIMKCVSDLKNTHGRIKQTEEKANAHLNDVTLQASSEMDQLKKQNMDYETDLKQLQTGIIILVNKSRAGDETINTDGISRINKLELKDVEGTNVNMLLPYIEDEIKAHKNKIKDLVNEIKNLKLEVKNIASEFGYNSANPLADIDMMSKKLKDFIEYTTNQSDIDEGLRLLRKLIGNIRTNPNFSTLNNTSVISMEMIADLLENEKKGNIRTKIPSLEELITVSNIHEDIQKLDNSDDVRERFELINNIEDKLEKTINHLNMQRKSFIKSLGLDPEIPIEQLFDIFEAKYDEVQMFKETIITIINGSDIKQKLTIESSDKSIFKSIQFIIDQSSEYKNKIEELNNTIFRTGLDDKKIIELLNGLSFDDDYKINMNKISEISNVDSDLSKKLIEFLKLKQNYDDQIISFAKSYNIDKQDDESTIELLIRTIQSIDTNYSELQTELNLEDDENVDLLNRNIKDRNILINQFKDKLKRMDKEDDENVDLLNSNIGDRNFLIKQFKNKLKRMSKEDKENRQIIELLQQEIDEKNKQIEELTDEIDSLNKRIFTIEEDGNKNNETLLIDLAKLREQNNILQGRILELEQANELLVDEINDLKTEKIDLEQKIIISLEDMAKYNDEIQSLISSSDKNDKLSQERIGELENKNEELEYKNKELVSSNRELISSNNDSITESVNESSTKIRDLIEENTNLIRQNDETDRLSQERISELESSNAELNNLKNVLQNKLDNLQSLVKQYKMLESVKEVDDEKISPLKNRTQSSIKQSNKLEYIEEGDEDSSVLNNSKNCMDEESKKEITEALSLINKISNNKGDIENMDISDQIKTLLRQVELLDDRDDNIRNIIKENFNEDLEQLNLEDAVSQLFHITTKQIEEINDTSKDEEIERLKDIIENLQHTAETLNMSNSDTETSANRDIEKCKDTIVSLNDEINDLLAKINDKDEYIKQLLAQSKIHLDEQKSFSTQTDVVSLENIDDLNNTIQDNLKEISSIKKTLSALEKERDGYKIQALKYKSEYERTNSLLEEYKHKRAEINQQKHKFQDLSNNTAQEYEDMKHKYKQIINDYKDEIRELKDQLHSKSYKKNNLHRDRDRHHSYKIIHHNRHKQKELKMSSALETIQSYKDEVLKLKRMIELQQMNMNNLVITIKDMQLTINRVNEENQTLRIDTYKKNLEIQEYTKKLKECIETNESNKAIYDDIRRKYENSDPALTKEYLELQSLYENNKKDQSLEISRLQKIILDLKQEIDLKHVTSTPVKHLDDTKLEKSHTDYDIVEEISYVKPKYVHKDYPQHNGDRPNKHGNSELDDKESSYSEFDDKESYMKPKHTHKYSPHRYNDKNNLYDKPNKHGNSEIDDRESYSEIDGKEYGESELDNNEYGNSEIDDNGDSEYEDDIDGKESYSELDDNSELDEEEYIRIKSY